MIIYHMCKVEEWKAVYESGVYWGSSQDQEDGFIHFSTAEYIVDSAAKHRAGQDGLLLLSVDSDTLGDAVKWEEARGGILFPHVYGGLPVSSVSEMEPLPVGSDGKHIFPNLVWNAANLRDR
jgi:uncharacterized protein (DUF952 family)